MPDHRAPEDIRAERDLVIANAEEAGKRPYGPKIGELRLELIGALEAEIAAVEAENEALRALTPAPGYSGPGSQAHDDFLAAATIPGARVPYNVGALPDGWDIDSHESNPYDTDEWRFIEKACAEVEIPKSGSVTGLVKWGYSVLDAKVKIWRISREIVKQVGIGEKWPQYKDLGRSNETGEPLPPKPAPAPVAASPEPRPTETEGGMPIRPGVPSAADIMATVAGGDAASIAAQFSPATTESVP